MTRPLSERLRDLAHLLRNPIAPDIEAAPDILDEAADALLRAEVVVAERDLWQGKSEAMEKLWKRAEERVKELERSPQDRFEYIRAALTHAEARIAKLEQERERFEYQEAAMENTDAHNTRLIARLRLAEKALRYASVPCTCGGELGHHDNCDRVAHDAFRKER